MELKQISDQLFLSAQISPDDLEKIADAGIRSIICNRPDAEGNDQTTFGDIESAALGYGIVARYLPVNPKVVDERDPIDFERAMNELPKPVLAYCRSGTRSATLWALSQSGKLPGSTILKSSQNSGYDMSAVLNEAIKNGELPGKKTPDASYDIVIVGAGAAGIASAASILKRSPELNIAIIDPADTHYYQPGWTMVGGGIFKDKETAKAMSSLIPKNVAWLKSAVTVFEPDNNLIMLDDETAIQYDRLVVCPGLKLDWDRIDGLTETLGKNGVTSNYRFDLAPYTWELVQSLKEGKAVFTQPPMPIKCAGAPQKALYLSADHWRRAGSLGNIDIEFRNAGGVLFGVKEYVPVLEQYMERYRAKLEFNNNLVAVDGEQKLAWFDVTKPDNTTERIETAFDMLHVCPPQSAPEFISASELADSAGWVDVDQLTLRHKTYSNIWSLGDVTNAPNAKTAAAARKQAPIVAANIIADINGQSTAAHYDGYGSCPLTVERGKIVLAEFGYGGKLLPTFPSWLIDGTKPTRAAWLLKEKILPPMYWSGMLKGHEWLVSPKKLVDS